MNILRDSVPINIEDGDICIQGGDKGHNTYHRQDHLEVEILGYGPETEETAEKWRECMKNPGHPTFIPVKEFGMDHLPKGSQTSDLFRAIKLSAELTVRLRVTETGKGSHTGTGHIMAVKPGLGPCPKDSPNWYRLHIMTAEHVVTNSEQALLTKVDLYYDDKESVGKRMKTYRGVKIIDTGVDGIDWCMLECQVCNEDVAAKVKSDLDELVEVTNKLCCMPLDQETKDVVVIVSHPHGQPKMVTVGKLNDRDMIPSLSYMTGYSPWVYGNIEYDADTCPGSSGARVIWLGFSPSHVSGGIIGYLKQCISNACKMLPPDTSMETFDHVWEIAHGQSVDIADTKTLFVFADMAIWSCLMFFFISVFSVIDVYGSAWLQFDLLPRLLVAPFYFIANIMFLLIISYQVGYYLTDVMLKLGVSYGKRCPNFIKSFLLTSLCSEGMLKWVIFLICCSLLYLSLFVRMFFQLSQPRSKDDFEELDDSIRDVFTDMSELFDVFTILLTALQGVSDRLIDSLKNEKLSRNVRLIHRLLPLYYIFSCWLGYWAFSHYFEITDSNVRRLITYMDYWPSVTFFYSFIIVQLVTTLIFLNKIGMFTIVQALFQQRPSRVLTFVHSQRSLGNDQNLSFVGVWFQNSQTEKDLRFGKKHI